MAQVLVQNRVSLAEPILPDLVKRRGVMVKKKSPIDPHDRQSVSRPTSSLTTSIRAITPRSSSATSWPGSKGVGDITYMGQRDYSMRVWLDPEKMSFRNLTAGRRHRRDRATKHPGCRRTDRPAAGAHGPGLPVHHEHAGPTRRSRAVRRHDPQERRRRPARPAQDVAKIELGAQAYDQTCTLDGKPSVALSIYQRPGSNALETAELVRKKMLELKDRFPAGLDYEIVYDTTPFIRESVFEVFKTLRDAVILVAVVVLAVPPELAVGHHSAGGCAGGHRRHVRGHGAFGFSLNNLTLFGLVLAIGIVVDDAIVVVEAVEHHIEHGLSPREATGRAMDDVSGPVVAIGLVLTAVFVPCAFITGIIGQFFRQFALTIATSTMISAFNSLTLSPALAALLLRPKSTDANAKIEALPKPAYALLGGWLGWSYAGALTSLAAWLQSKGWLETGPAEQSLNSLGVLLGRHPYEVGACMALLGLLLSGPLDRILSAFFRAFNTGFKQATNAYTRIVGGLLRVSLLVVLIYGGLLGLTYYGFHHDPHRLHPLARQGLSARQRPAPRFDLGGKDASGDGAGRESVAGKLAGVTHTVAIAGQSILLNANAPNYGAMYVMLDDFHHRTKPSLSGDAIAAKLLANSKRLFPTAR